MIYMSSSSLPVSHIVDLIAIIIRYLMLEWLFGSKKEEKKEKKEEEKED